MGMPFKVYDPRPEAKVMLEGYDAMTVVEGLLRQLYACRQTNTINDETFPIERKRPVLITCCPKCGGAWHGCVFDEIALYDIGLLKELTGYAKSGRKMYVAQAQTYTWCECKKAIQ